MIHENETGNSCYILMEGSVEVFTTDPKGEQKILSTLSQGAIFGETALLTQAPRNASVRTLEDSKILIIPRKSLLKLMGVDAGFLAQMMDVFKLRQRPQRCDGIETTHYKLEDGIPWVLLKNEKTDSYFRLSPEGWFIWQLLDGTHNLKDIALTYFEKFKVFAPQAIMDVLTGLGSSGFLKTTSLRSDVTKILMKGPLLQKIGFGIMRALNWRVVIRNVDPWLTTLYHFCFRFLYHKISFILISLAATWAAVLFIFQQQNVLSWEKQGAAIHMPSLILAFIFSVFVHELAHAFTTKAFGKKIASIGFGWIGFSPFVYVDTSEMWLAPKWQRVWVSLSGPFTHFILAGISIWIGHTSSLPSVTMTCWAFALISYLGMLINLNPLLELDGYYALSDALEKPNLKTQCSTWFKNLFLKRQFQMTKIEAIYFGWAVLNLMLCVLCLIIQSDYLNRMF